MLFKNLTYFINVQNMYHFLFEKLLDLYKLKIFKITVHKKLLCPKADRKDATFSFLHPQRPQTDPIPSFTRSRSARNYFYTLLFTSSQKTSFEIEWVVKIWKYLNDCLLGCSKANIKKSRTTINLRDRKETNHIKSN